MLLGLIVGLSIKKKTIKKERKSRSDSIVLNIENAGRTFSKTVWVNLSPSDTPIVLYWGPCLY